MVKFTRKQSTIGSITNYNISDENLTMELHLAGEALFMTSQKLNDIMAEYASEGALMSDLDLASRLIEQSDDFDGVMRALNKGGYFARFIATEIPSVISVGEEEVVGRACEEGIGSALKDAGKRAVEIGRKILAWIKEFFVRIFNKTKAQKMKLERIAKDKLKDLGRGDAKKFDDTKMAIWDKATLEAVIEKCKALLDVEVPSEADAASKFNALQGSLSDSFQALGYKLEQEDKEDDEDFDKYTFEREEDSKVFDYDTETLSDHKYGLFDLKKLHASALELVKVIEKSEKKQDKWKKSFDKNLSKVADGLDKLGEIDEAERPAKQKEIQKQLANLKEAGRLNSKVLEIAGSTGTKAIDFVIALFGKVTIDKK